MNRRTVIIALLTGLVFMLGAAGAARRDTGDSARPSPPATPREISGGIQANLVEGVLPADRVIRAVVGDDVRLRVRSSAPDVAKIDELGLQTSVGPGLDGELRFRVRTSGRYAVRLDVAAADAGSLVVVDAQDGAGAP